MVQFLSDVDAVLVFCGRDRDLRAVGSEWKNKILVVKIAGHSAPDKEHKWMRELVGCLVGLSTTLWPTASECWEALTKTLLFWERQKWPFVGKLQFLNVSVRVMIFFASWLQRWEKSLKRNKNCILKVNNSPACWQKVRQYTIVTGFNPLFELLLLLCWIFHVLLSLKVQNSDFFCRVKLSWAAQHFN